MLSKIILILFLSVSPIKVNKLPTIHYLKSGIATRAKINDYLVLHFDDPVPRNIELLNAGAQAKLGTKLILIKVIRKANSSEIVFKTVELGEYWINVTRVDNEETEYYRISVD